MNRRFATTINAGNLAIDLSELLVRLEDMKFYRTADRLMSVLLNCKPKEASHCEKANLGRGDDERGSKRSKESSRKLKNKG